MAIVWKTFQKGIRYYEHESRMVKKGSRQRDRYWQLKYRMGEKVISESLGWESEDWSELFVIDLSTRLARNRKEGKKPGTFKELKEENQLKNQAIIEAKTEAEEQIKMEALRNKTFGNIWNDYIKSRQYEVRNLRTVKEETGRWEVSIKPMFENIILSKLTPDRITDFIVECKNPTQLRNIRGKLEIPKQKSLSTINKHLDVISQLWNFGKNLGYCSGENPTREKTIKKIAPASKVARQRFLSETEAERLLSELKSRSLITWVKATLLLYSGIRPGEMHNLRWADVENDNIYIHKETKTIKGGPRNIKMSNKIKLALDEIRPKREELSLYELIFKETTEISDTFKRVVDDLKLNNGITRDTDKVVPYTLRHTFASWLAQRGTPMHTIASLMGHTTQTVTERYAHLAPSHLSQAIDTL
ncbi:tyrosine-type recombinase/integrase [Desulfovibrio desulfuricans]|uniref:tyrosine-type recombinase/integrase n=1 Tax=Desulfovibrio desulfuricans TaxID=876 RepID=UPI0003B383E7|nr:site-specific integrase [Desulfovibrio desulfuricans]